MLCDLDKQGRIHEKRHAFWGELVHAKHKISVRFKGLVEVVPDEYYHGLYHWPKSGVALWPAELQEISEGAAKVLLYTFKQRLPTIWLASGNPGRYTVFTSSGAVG